MSRLFALTVLALSCGALVHADVVNTQWTASSTVTTAGHGTLKGVSVDVTTAAVGNGLHFPKFYPIYAASRSNRSVVA